MNFTPFLSHFTSSIGALPTVNNGSISFSPGPKHSASSNTTAAGFTGGQVVALLNSDDSGVTYLHPVDINGYSVNVGNTLPVNQHQNQVIALPVTISGTKPGDQPQQQTLQIQVVNPTSAGNNCEKLIPVPLQHFGHVLQVAYNQQSSVNKSNNNLSQVKVQPNTLFGCPNNNTSIDIGPLQKTVQCLNDNRTQIYSNVKPSSFNDLHNSIESNEQDKNSSACPLTVVVPPDVILRTALGDHVINGANNVEEELNGNKSSNKDGLEWQAIPINSSMAEYLSNLPSDSLPISLHHFLKFSSDTIKRETADSYVLNEDVDLNNGIVENQIDELDQLKTKKKKKYKKKPPKPKRPRPGQVHIATAIDGTLLFCCPECNMAYPDKDMLEQHLIAHKIERRFICDICGAGLKRKEHLERHKLGHNPERPYVCTICTKGFKRKEHLNLHVVIHSGEKTEVCTECGKGFYRRDHLRKHAKSHLARKMREEIQQQQQEFQRQQQLQRQQQFQQHNQQQHQQHQQQLSSEVRPDTMIISSPSLIRQCSATNSQHDDMLVRSSSSSYGSNEMHNPLEPATIITTTPLTTSDVETISVEPDCHLEHLSTFEKEKT